MTDMKNKSNHKLFVAIGLTAILALGAFLRFYKLGAYSIGNTYYAAAVKSMLTSWSNFFYVAFEPGGSVTVDKPPLGFWVQAASAYLFGVNGFALALPQALAGTLSIAVLYHLVRKYFGVWAGLTAALVLALTPITIATERNNTIDGLLVFVLLLAAWAFLIAAERGRFRYLLLGAFLIGLGFNIKMLQAYMILPAFYAVYLFGTRTDWWKRILHLGAATVVLLVVSFAWVAAVDLTPADQRPYIGSSENNTVLELIIGHNGLSRLGLNDYGPRDSAPPGGGGPNPPRAGFHAPRQNPGPGPGQSDRQPPPEAIEACDGINAGDACTVELPNRDVEGICRFMGDDQLVCVPQAPNAQAVTPPLSPNNPSAGGRGINGGETGSAGVLRLFQEPLATEMSWLLPLVILGLPLVLVAMGWSWPLDRRHNSLILWAGWLLPAMAYFSFTTGLFHRYYLIMLGPPLAAFVGITFWGLAQLWKKNHWVGWLSLIFLSGLTVVFELFTIRTYPEYALGVILGTLALWIIGIGLLILKPWPQLRKIGLALILAALLVAPLTWSALTVWNTNPNVALPTAGVSESDRTRASMMTPNQELLDDYGQAVLDYTLANTDPDAYLLAATNARSAAPFILETGRPVLTFGGFTGRDDVIELDELIAMIESGELRYILGIPQGKQEIARWMQSNCSVVDLQTSEVFMDFNNLIR
jgi:4-amino-4-deoxy-L-arabinose transferase-like glycosyltransferase